VCRRSGLLTGEEGGGGREGAESYDGGKACSSIDNSILSGYTNTLMRVSESQYRRNVTFQFVWFLAKMMYVLKNKILVTWRAYTVYGYKVQYMNRTVNSIMGRIPIV